MKFEVKDEKEDFYCYISLKTTKSKQYVENLIKKIFNDNLDCDDDFCNTFEEKIKKIEQFENIKFCYKKKKQDNKRNTKEYIKEKNT